VIEQPRKLVEVKAYKAEKYAVSVSPDDYLVLVAYMNVHDVQLALKKCGDDRRGRPDPPGRVAARKTIADDAARHLDQYQAR